MFQLKQSFCLFAEFHLLSLCMQFEFVTLVEVTTLDHQQIRFLKELHNQHRLETTTKKSLTN